MMIDALAGIPLPGVIDVKLEKKEGFDAPRPIEEPKSSPDPELNIQKEKISKHRAEKENHAEKERVESYNAKGEPVWEDVQKDEEDSESPSINLQV
jgi:hypothetical protein